jgi:hypothetical protein
MEKTIHVRRREEDENDGSSWRFCLPRLKAESALNDEKESEETSSHPAIPDDTPLEDFFRVGHQLHFEQRLLPNSNIEQRKGTTRST